MLNYVPQTNMRHVEVLTPDTAESDLAYKQDTVDIVKMRSEGSGWGPWVNILLWCDSSSLWPHGLQPTRLLCPWDFPGKNIGVGCHFLLATGVSKYGNSSTEYWNGTPFLRDQTWDSCISCFGRQVFFFSFFFFNTESPGKPESIWLVS